MIATVRSSVPPSSEIDGTLVDSAADICGAVQTVLAETSRPDVPYDFLKRYIGRHLIDLFEELFPDAAPEQIDALIQKYRSIYPARDHAQTLVFPGVRDTLAVLPGRKSTATTKGTPTTRVVLQRFGLLPYFDHVQGTDGFPHKPAPDVLVKSLDVFGVRPEDALFVGDSAADMEAGRRAGCRS